MYYCNSRYYVPEWCRWLNADNIAFLDPSSVKTTNLFAYCGNNPITNIDNEGNSFWRAALDLAICATSAIVGTAVGSVTGLTAGIVAGTATFGAINNAVNAYYYNNISDAESDLTSKSYSVDGSKYHDRFDRLDYTKKQTRENEYNYTAWTYYSEYNIHMNAWLLTFWAHEREEYGIFSDIAESAKDAYIKIGNPFANVIPVTAMTFVAGLLGM